MTGFIRRMTSGHPPSRAVTWEPVPVSQVRKLRHRGGPISFSKIHGWEGAGTGFELSSEGLGPKPPKPAAEAKGVPSRLFPSACPSGGRSVFIRRACSCEGSCRVPRGGGGFQRPIPHSVLGWAGGEVLRDLSGLLCDPLQNYSVIVIIVLSNLFWRTTILKLGKNTA